MTFTLRESTVEITNKLTKIYQNIKNIVCSGKRAKELALRLKYCGVNANVVVNEAIPEAVAKLKSYNEKYAIAIPNYTALVETQRELEK